MKIKNLLLFIFLMIVSTSVCSKSEIKNFDSLCTLIQDVMKLDLKPQARLDYVKNNIKSKVHSRDVIESYNLIFQIEPIQRYQVFKQSVKNATGHTWECPALNDFFK